jgi:hypothetical protein
MLEGNGWNVEGAIDFFFATGTTGVVDSGAGRTGGSHAGTGPAAPNLQGEFGTDEHDVSGGMENEDRELQVVICDVSCCGWFQEVSLPFL